MGRRVVKEFRAPEALALIEADRERQPLLCPYCEKPSVKRDPVRKGAEPTPGRVTLECGGCGRHVSFLERITADQAEAPI